MRRDTRVWLLVSAALFLAGVTIFVLPGGRASLFGPREPEPRPGTGSVDGTQSPMLEGRQPRQGTVGPRPSTAPQILARDVHTGKPIAGLALRIASEEGPAREAVSSATGGIHLGDAEAAASVTPISEGWVLADDESIAKGGRVLWFYRLVEIRGRVRVSGGTGADRLQETTVTVVAPQPQHKSREAPSQAIGSYQWMSRRGLQQVRERIEVRAPAVRSLPPRRPERG